MRYLEPCYLRQLHPSQAYGIYLYLDIDYKITLKIEFQRRAVLAAEAHHHQDHPDFMCVCRPGSWLCKLDHRLPSKTPMIRGLCVLWFMLLFIPMDWSSLCSSNQEMALHELLKIHFWIKILSSLKILPTIYRSPASWDCTNRHLKWPKNCIFLHVTTLVYRTPL